MSMVLFALVMRSTDGLPLSATTDYEQDEGLQETKKQIKTLSEKLSTFPSRCSLKTGKFNIHFTSSLGLGYLVVCTENCPNALAFCFLEEMQSQFLHRCDGFLIRNAVRPYSSSEFDDFLQDTKQRYNSPCSLTSKISLADMQSELKMIPTYQLSPEDLRSCFSRRNVFRYKSITPSQLLEPVSLRGIMSCVLSIFCGGLNLLQGFHAIEGFMQFYLFGYFSVRRNSKSFLAFALICLSNICLFELRNVWQILFHVTVAAFMTLQIRLRQLQCKAPDYNV
ncbi:vesicle-trafficking protein SEC22a isoform X2 [Salmo salar]|uniref:Vesicle-trafficking protein SEC22a isoform X2 n=1 Tax=Salmo salar TaxID=8030 RepID=A0A1S3PP98_SALSA|nr:vesicle-trafficking protein SEC22a isoform X2 [Salmo salar]|eukprot:XP_014029104.1 PREDICTED: vesicle-trafficking protein SEC22a-like isoform X2 [Salmo salar]